MSRGYSKHVKSLLVTLLFGIGLTCLCGSYMVTTMMGHLTVEQVLFHLRTPLAGVSTEILGIVHSFAMEMVFWIVVFWSVCSGFLEWCLGHLMKRQISWERWRMRICVGMTGILWLVMSVYVFFNHDLGTFAYNLAHPSHMIDHQYVCPVDTEFREPARKRNLVIIVSESLERTYENSSFFGGNLLRELHELEPAGICFQGQIEVNGTDSTISSIGALLYGLPRLLVGMEGWHNYIHGNLFHGSTSILHILHEHGYDIWHIQGGDLDFADTRSLFEDFPQAHVIGRDEIQEDKAYRRLMEHMPEYGWGINDDIMLKIARGKLKEASQSKRPFVMSISTLDSHYDGFLDETSQREYGDFRDIVRAQSRMLAEFIRWIQAQPFGGDTTIVLVGDHYVMRDDVGDCDMSTLTNGTSLVDEHGGMPERTVYSCIFNAVQDASEHATQRLFCSFDWAPTILESIGFRWPSHRFGLGVSLFSGEQTLLEKVGGKVYERESRRRSETYGKILASGNGK